jgi:methanogenic corrinoid protein MtbC1
MIAASTIRSASSIDCVLANYVEALLDGSRKDARKVVESALAKGWTAATLLAEMIWPAMEKVQTDYKGDYISVAQMNLATRLNRSMTDLLGGKLERAASNGKKVLVFCGNAEPEELGGQITADLFEAAGYEVKFAGGGVPDDEVQGLIGSERPDLLVMFATLPSGVPAVRKLIDYLREVNANPSMQIMCCGGIYRRAEGLAEEIGADLYAPDAISAVTIASENQGRRANLDQQTVGRGRRTKKAAARRGPILGTITPSTGPSGPTTTFSRAV